MNKKADPMDELPEVGIGQEPARIAVTNRQIDLNTLDKRAKVLLRVNPVALAGGGPVTQTIQIDQWLDLLSEQNNKIEVRRIGVATQAGLADPAVIGPIPDLNRTIPAGLSISDIYHNVSTVVSDEIDYLYSKGKRHFACVCCGYTSYGLFALKRAVDTLNASHPDDPITGNVIIQDSSFPDVDTLSTELDERGYPFTRFYGPAYESTTYLRIVFTLNGTLSFDISLSKRVPTGCTPIMTTFPYTEDYIGRWQTARKTSKFEARKQLEAALPGLTKSTSTDWIIPLIASGGCWDKNNVGKWMTAEQYETMVEGTLTIVRALLYVAERGNRRIFMPLSGKGVDIVLSKHMPYVYSEHQNLNDDSDPGVVLLPSDSLSHRSFVDLVTGADLIINRTVQANSFAETLLARAPQVVVTIPAAGYMEAELMAQGIKYGLLRYNQDPSEMGAEIYRILTEPEYRDTLVNGLYDMFDSMYSDPNSNFGEVLARVARLGLSSIGGESLPER